MVNHMKNWILKRGKLAGGLSLLLALSLTVSLVVSALAVPLFDNVFWGTVSVCTTLVDEGTVVSARIEGVEVASTTVVHLHLRYLASKTI